MGQEILKAISTVEPDVVMSLAANVQGTSKKKSLMNHNNYNISEKLKFN
jgi:hypothetical protein